MKESNKLGLLLVGAMLVALILHIVLSILP